MVYKVRKYMALLLLCLLAPAPAASLPTDLINQLKNNPSPYLALHGEDPVAWQSWSERVFKLAQQTNKLIFVSSGYFSCHWCHVMQRESYSDNAVAKTLNTDFIPVKVDRELQPALDAYLIDFVQDTRGFAGWPLNVFLTPEGYPVAGLVYLPKDQFQNVLLQVARAWNANSPSIRQAAAQAAQRQMAKPPVYEKELQPGIGKSLHVQMLQQTMQAADEFLGGFGDQARFPMVAQLNYLLASLQQQSDNNIRQFLQLTLEQMATRGMRDHIGGGFFRYTVDPDWQTPHFEKMLYDNAQLAGLYLDAAKVLQRRDFQAIGRETLNFILREMKGENGAFVSSLSAVDNHNVEGGYYLWPRETLGKLLTAEEYQVVGLLWNLKQPSQFQGGYLPRYAVSPGEVAAQLDLPRGKVMHILAKVYGKLLEARKNRQVPVDAKQLAGWNGLALSALVKGARLAGGDKYRTAAQRLRDYLITELWDGKQLWRAKSGGKPIVAAGLDDYAYAARGLLQWSLLNGDPAERLLVKRWINIAWQRFYTPVGWRLSEQLNLPGIFGRPVMEDNPMPSPSSVVIETSLHLAELEHDQKLRRRAVTALAMSQEVLRNQPFAYATQIQIITRLEAVKRQGRDRR